MVDMVYGLFRPALTFWNIPTCYTANLAALEQISISIEEAYLNLGANNFTTLIKIVIPLLKISFVSGLSVAFLRTVTCLSVVIFIYSASTSVGTISILGLVQNGDYASASAFTAVLITIAFTILGVTQLILKRYSKTLNL